VIHKLCTNYHKHTRKKKIISRCKLYSDYPMIYEKICKHPSCGTKRKMKHILEQMLVQLIVKYYSSVNY